MSSPAVRPLVVVFDASFAADRGGTGRYLREMQRALAARDDVDLRVWRTPRVERLPRVLRLPLNLALHLVGTQVLLPWWARRQGADVIWCSMLAPLPRRVPVVLTLHDAIDARPELRSSRLWSASMRTLGAAGARRAALVVTGSYAAAREIAHAYGVATVRVAVTPYGVGALSDADEDAGTDCFSAAPYVLLVGSAGPRKRHDVVLAAVREVRRCGVNLQLVVVGRTTAAARLEPWVHEQRDVSDAALAGLYRDSVALLLPSLHEGYGFPAVEARAYGTPVISADLDAVREQVPQALFVRSWEPAAWAAAIEAVLRGEAPVGATNAAQVPTWEQTAALTVTAIRTVVRPALRHIAAEKGQLRVLCLHPSDAAYGADRWLQQVLREQASGMQITVLLPRQVPSGPLRAWLSQMEVPHDSTRLPIVQRSALRSGRGAMRLLVDAIVGVPALMRRVRAERPDVVVSNTLAICAGPLAAWMTRTPHVWHVHEVVIDEPPVVRWMLRAAVRWLPGVVIANSQATADALRIPRRDRSSRRAANVRVIPNGVEQVVQRDDARVTDGPLRVAVLGRVSARKGWREALDALAAVQADGGTVTLDWFGAAPDDDADALARAREYAASLGLTERVTFHGHVDDAAERLVTFDVLLLPSQRPESFSLAVLEGMAAGCAVVAVRSGGGSDALVQHGQSGLLCDADHGSIAAALLDLASNRQRVRAMGERGQDLARAYPADATRRAVHVVWREAAEAGRHWSPVVAAHPGQDAVT